MATAGYPRPRAKTHCRSTSHRAGLDRGALHTPQSPAPGPAPQANKSCLPPTSSPVSMPCPLSPKAHSWGEDAGGTV